VDGDGLVRGRSVTVPDIHSDTERDNTSLLRCTGTDRRPSDSDSDEVKPWAEVSDAK